MAAHSRKVAPLFTGRTLNSCRNRTRDAGKKMKWHTVEMFLLQRCSFLPGDGAINIHGDQFSKVKYRSGPKRDSGKSKGGEQGRSGYKRIE